MSITPQDMKSVGVRCPQCGELHKKTIGWIRANATMQCAGCGVTIRLGKNRLTDKLPFLSAKASQWRPGVQTHLPAVIWLAAFVGFFGVMGWLFINDPARVPQSSRVNAGVRSSRVNPGAAGHIQEYVPPVPTQPVPTCESPVTSGSVLAIGTNFDVKDWRKVEIYNGSQGNAIINVHSVSAGKTVASFFVASGEYAVFSHVPDDAIRIQWIFGDLLNADCTTFVQPTGVGEFDDAVNMHKLQSISYTLYPVRNGNARSHAISIADFYKK